MSHLTAQSSLSPNVQVLFAQHLAKLQPRTSHIVPLWVGRSHLTVQLVLLEQGKLQVMDG
jgi:hypothetical protein